MTKNRRKFARRPIAYPAKIVASDGSWGRRCRVIDVSEGGAKLATESAVDVPANFILAFATRGHAMRKCHVVWSDGCELGVRFLREDEKKA